MPTANSNDTLVEANQQLAHAAAVERVRAEALSMQKSKDINKVAAVLYKEIRKLGIETVDSAIVFMDAEAQTAYNYNAFPNLRQYAEPDRPAEEYVIVEVDDEIMVFYFESPFAQIEKRNLVDGKNAVEGWQTGEIWTLTRTFTEEGLRNFWTDLGFGTLTSDQIPSFSALPCELVTTCVPFEYGFVRFRTEEFSQHNADIVAELTAALSVGYLRFLDLQRLEQQAESLQQQTEQAQRGQAIERVRAEAMAMRSSADLMDVVGVMHQSLHQLGVEPFSTSIHFVDEAEEQFQHYLAVPDMEPYGFVLDAFNDAILQAPIKLVEGGWRVRWIRTSSEERLAVWRAGHITTKVSSIEPENYRQRGSTWYAPDPDKADWSIWEPTRGEWDYTEVPFEYGVVTFNVRTVSEQHLTIVQALTEALSLGYVRFLDLQAAEERQRQTERERAIERIRAEAMAMRQSDDLLNVVSVLYLELQQLGFDPLWSNIWFIDEEAEVLTVYNAGVNPRQYGTPFNVSGMREFSDDVVTWIPHRIPFSDPLWDSATVRTVYEQEQPSTSRIDYTRDIFERIHNRHGIRMDDLAPDYIEKNIGTHYRFMVPFKYGVVSFVQHQPIEGADLQDLADALSLGYLRYLDFQQLEERNRNLLAEAALERVRTQALAMQKSEHIANVVITINEQLQELGFSLWCTGISVSDLQLGIRDSWYIQPHSKNILYNQTQLSQLETSEFAYTRGYLESRQNDEPHFTYIWTQEEFAAYFLFLQRELGWDFGADWQIPDPASYAEGRVISHQLIASQESKLTLWVKQQLSAADLAIAQRFADTFGFAYTRFLELQQAEERQRQAELERSIERVRASALDMRHSDDINKVAAVLYKEVISLGVKTIESAIVFRDEETETSHNYHAFSNLRQYGEPDRPASVPVVEVDDEVMVYYFEMTFDQIDELQLADGVNANEGWKTGKVWTLTRNFTEDSIRRFYESKGYGTLTSEILPLAFPCDLVSTCIPFQYGFVRIRWDEFRQQDADIVAALTEALALGYTRFLDLQAAEERQHQLEDEVGERKRAEEAMRQSKDEAEKAQAEAEAARSAAEAANRAKSQFLANMSHEIRTPMNAILGYAQLLQRDAALSQDQRQSVETIEKSGDHLLRLINDVLDLSKIEAGRLELTPADFDLHKLLQSLATMFALRCEQQRLGWQLTGVSDEPLPVHGDEAKLSQILINLLGNAVKFTKAGEVALHFTAQDENRYHFEVADTGPGIDPKEQHTLFAAFEQGLAGHDQGGTGLGLSITSSLLDLMDATLELDSAKGEGARFSFTLTLPPAQGALPQTQNADWSQARQLKAGYTIRALVVDDVRENRDVLSSLLRAIGVEVQLAESGEAALAALQQQMPDIIFMDIRMPGLDGMETTQRLWRQWGQDATKIVAISASVLDHERRGYLEAGFDAFIDKPFRTARIYGCLADLLGVEFDYAEVVPVDAKAALDWTGIALPAELTQRMKEAAELTSVTELDGLLGEVAALGETGQQLAAHLRQLSQDFDMDGVIAVLDEIEKN